MVFRIFGAVLGLRQETEQEWSIKLFDEIGREVLGEALSPGFAEEVFEFHKRFHSEDEILSRNAYWGREFWEGRRDGHLR